MTITEFKTKLKKRIWFYLKKIFYFQIVADPILIRNINYNSNSPQKKAIVCYITMMYFTDLDAKRIGRTQPFEIMKIVKIFSDLGYVIDIINCLDVKAIEVVKDRKYDLIFGFGDSFYQLTNLQPSAISILYMTENHPEFSFREERKRLDYYNQRHGRNLPLRRSGKYYHISHLRKNYSGLIWMGTDEFLENVSNKYSIFPTGIINPDFVYYTKDHKDGRRNYLWLGSTGAVHKGLDLLLDVFNNRDDIFLHICGLEKMDRELLIRSKRENILEYGHIDIQSEIFLKLVDKCSYIILPSCSEGFSTSITTGMLHGLIPVVMRNSGFDRMGNSGVYLEDFSIEYLTMKLNELSDTDPERLAFLSEQAFHFARKNFTIQEFEARFITIISNILKVNT